MAQPRETPSSSPKAESRLDEALEDTFPASDPVSLGHTDHAGAPPGHKTDNRHENRGKTDATAVVDNPSQSRFELALGDAVAAAYYKRDGDRLTLVHTEVPQEFSGRGVGSILAHGVFETLRTKGLRVVAECPFMASYASRHPEYASILES
jgi:uncharacterized protein